MVGLCIVKLQKFEVAMSNLKTALNHVHDAERFLARQEALVQFLRDHGQDTGSLPRMLEMLRQGLRVTRERLFNLIVNADLTWEPERDKKLVRRRL